MCYIFKVKNTIEDERGIQIKIKGVISQYKHTRERKAIR